MLIRNMTMNIGDMRNSTGNIRQEGKAGLEGILEHRIELPKRVSSLLRCLEAT